MQKDADVCKVMQAWGMEEGLQVLTACAREWESCGNITGVFDTLLPRSTQTPNQPTFPTEEVETTAENDGEASEFLDVIFLLIRQQIPASQFGVLMTRILKYLGVAHCKHPPHPPSIVKEATVLCKERVALFVANWGPAAVVDLMDKRKEELRSGEAINMLRSEREHTFDYYQYRVYSYTHTANVLVACIQPPLLQDVCVPGQCE